MEHCNPHCFVRSQVTGVKLPIGGRVVMLELVLFLEVVPVQATSPVPGPFAGVGLFVEVMSV